MTERATFPKGRPFPPPSPPRRLDARVKILLLIAFCFVTQYFERLAAFFITPSSAESSLPIWVAILFGLFLIREMRTAAMWMMLKGGVFFALFWLVMKMLSDLAGGADPATSLASSLPMTWRLLAFALLGMGMIGLSSPVETGRAVAWFIRPVFGRAAWKPALSVALVAWFLPQTLRLAGQVRAAIRARGLRLSRRRKVVVIIGTSLRILLRRADELAVALASRRLDDYRSWR